MGKILAVGEAVVVIKELWNSASDFFEKLVPKDFYKMLDDIAFLDAKFLEVSSDGKMLDNSAKIAEAILNLSNFVIWGILLFYAFKSIFAYFISKNSDVPWKFFIRIIIFGILANASVFICYTGIFLTENSTEYLREYIGKDKVSFSILEDYIVEEELGQEEEVYTFDAIMSIFIYFSTFFLSICLGGRYILLKTLILFSPIFFILGGFKDSEKIFFSWCKKIVFLLFMQLFLCVILGVVNLCDSDEKLFSQLLICSMLFLISKNTVRFLNLSS